MVATGSDNQRDSRPVERNIAARSNSGSLKEVEDKDLSAAKVKVKNLRDIDQGSSIKVRYSLAPQVQACARYGERKTADKVGCRAATALQRGSVEETEIYSPQWDEASRFSKEPEEWITSSSA